MHFISVSCKEDLECKSFTKHIDEQTEKKFLVVISQDGDLTSVRCKNVSAGDVASQLKLANLLH